MACLQAQQYHGRPVLSWFQGEIVFPPGYGRGEYVVVDEHYQRIATVRAGNGLVADMHDFVITPQGTGLLLCYRDVRRDLTYLGGSASALVTEGVAQEVDLLTGQVLFEWHSADHVPESESMLPLPPDPNQPYDYFHINSVRPDDEASLLISARNTHAVYQISRDTGTVTWRLGGKRSDFGMQPGSVFAWQHDAQRQPDGTISLFDNGPSSGSDSARALVLAVDENTRTATAIRSDHSPTGEASASQGNSQVLPEGHIVAGWGALMSYSEFGPDGHLLYDAGFVDRITSYRSLRATWIGTPLDLPAVAATSVSSGTDVYTSWNGATEVATWRILAGSDPHDLQPVRDGARTAFETRIRVPSHETHVAAQALDANGTVLATSQPTRVT